VVRLVRYAGVEFTSPIVALVSPNATAVAAPSGWGNRTSHVFCTRMRIRSWGFTCIQVTALSAGMTTEIAMRRTNPRFSTFVRRIIVGAVATHYRWRGSDALSLAR
jgi:hypothetical protein